jgi:hypothetical protein
MKMRMAPLSPNRRLRRRDLLLAALLPAIARADKALPQRDLLIELREAGAGEQAAGAGASGWNVRSGDASAARERPPQRLRVLNGASASLSLSVTRPLQVWQPAPGLLAPGMAGASVPGTPPTPATTPPSKPRPVTTPSGTVPTGKVTAPPGAGRPGLAQAGAALPMAVPETQWMQAGQQLTLRPRWPGGHEPVTVTLSTESSAIDPSVAPGSAELPQRIGAQLVTTVSAPLGQWVTLAATGAGDDDMTVVSSGQAKPSARRVLQLRVSLAP